MQSLPPLHDPKGLGQHAEKVFELHFINTLNFANTVAFIRAQDFKMHQLGVPPAGSGHPLQVLLRPGFPFRLVL